MSWFRFDSGAPEHPKVKRLARTLGLTAPVALGYLATLWARTCSLAPSGDLGNFDAEDVAGMADWPDDASTFVEALVGARLLDQVEGGGYLVHDWLDRAEGYKRAIAEKKRRNNKRVDPKTVPHACPTRAPRSGTRAPESVTRAPDGEDGRRGQTERTDVGGADTPPGASSPSELFLVPPAAEEPPAVLEFPAAGRRGGKQAAVFGLTAASLAEMVAAFPSLDVEAVLDECLRKVRTEACRMPTTKGYPAFLWSWLRREADSPTSRHQRTRHLARGTGPPPERTGPRTNAERAAARALELREQERRSEREAEAVKRPDGTWEVMP